MSNSSGAQHLLIFLCGVEFLCGMNVSYGMVFLSRAANERDEQLAGGFHRRSDARAKLCHSGRRHETDFRNFHCTCDLRNSGCARGSVCGQKREVIFRDSAVSALLCASVGVDNYRGDLLPDFLLHHLSIVSV